jgi:hypothetical protein
MNQFEELTEKELLFIYGGSEESYSWGYKIGNFLGAMTSNALNAMHAFAEGVREGVKAVETLKK